MNLFEWEACLAHLVLVLVLVLYLSPCLFAAVAAVSGVA